MRRGAATGQVPGIAAALALALCAAPLVGRCDAEAPSAEPSVLVETAALVQGSLPQAVLSYGVAETSPSARRSVVARIAAVVTAVQVRVGEVVRPGAPLVELTPTPSTRSAYSAALSAQREAADALARTRALVGDSLATGQQLAAAEKADTDARAALNALEAQGAAGPSVIRAPFAAVVAAVTAAPDSIVAEGAPLLELTRPDGVILITGVVPAQAASIKAGDAVHIEALGGTRPFDGRVSQRGALVDAASGLVPVEISIPEHALMPGEMARASIITGEARGFVVPHAAVLVDDRGDTYVVQSARGVARKVPVTILATADGKDAVSGQLDASAPVITAGNHQLQDGMKLRFQSEAADAHR
jgi:membrane fusion protein (multidrug efflux system)